MKEEETVAEEVVCEEKEARKVFLKWNKWYDVVRPRRPVFLVIHTVYGLSQVMCSHGFTVKYGKVIM